MNPPFLDGTRGRKATKYVYIASSTIEPRCKVDKSGGWVRYWICNRGHIWAIGTHKLISTDITYTPTTTTPIRLYRNRSPFSRQDKKVLMAGVKSPPVPCERQRMHYFHDRAESSFSKKLSLFSAIPQPFLFFQSVTPRKYSPQLDIISL